ncbi:quinolinate synthase NadA, partial [Chryseobacterium sp. SIMBA_029]
TETDDQGRVPVIPVTYMNSSAALKAFCGRNGGIVCTSSNATVVLEWAFERGQRVLFFPDQHLGRNTAKALGVPLEQMP